MTDRENRKPPKNESLEITEIVDLLDDEAPARTRIRRDGEIVHTEVIRYVRVSDDLTGRIGAEPTSEDVIADQRGATPGLIAGGLLAVATLLAFGWYLGTRSEDQQVEAIIEALPDSDRRLDDFERPSPTPLEGEAPRGTTWSALGASIIAGGGSAVVAPVPADETALALTDTGWSNLSAGIAVGHAPAGAGLVFRFVDLFNYWSIVAAPEFGTWNLVLTVEGQAGQSHATGLSSTEPGTRVSVAMSGPEIRVFVDGAPVFIIVDPTFEQATTTGLIAQAGTDASFTEFFAVQDQVGLVEE